MECPSASLNLPLLFLGWIEKSTTLVHLLIASSKTKANTMIAPTPQGLSDKCFPPFFCFDVSVPYVTDMHEWILMNRCAFIKGPEPKLSFRSWRTTSRLFSRWVTSNRPGQMMRSLPTILQSQQSGFGCESERGACTRKALALAARGHHAGWRHAMEHCDARAERNHRLN